MAGLHFIDPSAATLPQAELIAMSKTQLIQCVTALQAGWTAAKRQLGAAGRDREIDESRVREEIAAQRAATMAAESQLRAAETVTKQLRARNFELETEVAKLRRAAAANPADPAMARLQDELVVAQGRAVELERLVRQREPLNVQFLKIQVEEMGRQRERDKLKLQEAAISITRLQQQLRDAEEATAFRRDATSDSPADRSPRTSPHAPSRDARVSFAAQPNLSATRPVLPNNPATRKAKPSPPDARPPGVDHGTQTEAGTARLVELLQARSDEISTVRTDLSRSIEENAALSEEVHALTAEVRLLREAERRKDELLEELASPTRLVRLSSFKGKDDVERDERDRAEAGERRRRLEAMLDLAEERAKSAEERARSMEVEVGRVTRSFATVAEENVHLSHALEALGAANPRDVAAMLTAAENARRLAATVAGLQAELDRVRVDGAELEKLGRENGALRARVEKSQLEVGALATESAKLSGELQDAYLLLEAQAPLVENNRAEQRRARAAAVAVLHFCSAAVETALDAACNKSLLLVAFASGAAKNDP